MISLLCKRAKPTMGFKNIHWKSCTIFCCFFLGVSYHKSSTENWVIQTLVYILLNEKKKRNVLRDFTQSYEGAARVIYTTTNTNSPQPPKMPGLGLTMFSPGAHGPIRVSSNLHILFSIQSVWVVENSLL